MEYSLMTKVLCEFIGTAILIILGNGAIANSVLKNTKGHGAGWLDMATAAGFGVAIPVLMFGGISGGHLNPAITLAQAVAGNLPWADVLPYAAGQLLGSMAGMLAVYAIYYPHYQATEDAQAIFSTFSMDDAAKSKANFFITECLGTFVLVFSAISCLNLPWGKQNPAAAAFIVGTILWGLILGIGGTTGPSLNPVRDWGPRIMHQILPIAHKGSSKWGDAWITLIAPLIGGTIAGLLFHAMFM